MSYRSELDRACQNYLDARGDTSMTGATLAIMVEGVLVSIGVVAAGDIALAAQRANIYSQWETKSESKASDEVESSEEIGYEGER